MRNEADEVLCKTYLEFEKSPVLVYFRYFLFLRFGDIEITLDDFLLYERLKLSVVKLFY